MKKRRNHIPAGAYIHNLETTVQSDSTASGQTPGGGIRRGRTESDFHTVEPCCGAAIRAVDARHRTERRVRRLEHERGSAGDDSGCDATEPQQPESRQQDPGQSHGGGVVLGDDGAPDAADAGLCQGQDQGSVH